MQKRSNQHIAIYKKAHGTIPCDELGRKYDIHHIDGDHTNNSIDNLIAVSLQEHYNIHYQRGDYQACILIGLRMNLTKEEISVLNSEAANRRVSEGKHHWVGPEHGRKVKERIKASVADGTYHMLGGEIQRSVQLKRSNQGLHQWNGPSSNQRMLENGTHPSQKEFICPHCGVSGKGVTNGKRWHFDNCKKK